MPEASVANLTDRVGTAVQHERDRRSDKDTPTCLKQEYNDFNPGCVFSLKRTLGSANSTRHCTSSKQHKTRWRVELDTEDSRHRDDVPLIGRTGGVQRQVPTIHETLKVPHAQFICKVMDVALMSQRQD